ncbi:hypothetical protein [Ramlibacter sp. PS4R-6]|uniref:hypothetical protein n=1 Tax=Ramlibacter sp. PS4R-6 TaxID=3133438 RepID=UPI003098A272
MAAFRVLMLLMLVASGASFVLYAATGQMRFRKFGIRVLLGAIAAALVFFAVLIAENLLAG